MILKLHNEFKSYSVFAGSGTFFLVVVLLPTGLLCPVYKLVLQLDHVFSNSLFMSNGELSGLPASHKIQASVGDEEEEQT